MDDTLRSCARDEKGFTLVEILVVILIIGILAAIALPAFLNQRGKAQDTEAKVQARTLQTAEESLYATEQSYSLGALPRLAAMESSLTSGKATPAVASTTADSFVVESTSITGNVYTIAKATTGVVTRTCTTGGKFGCPLDGSW
jgi:type IV pilus assembly protein PilA